MGRNIQWQVLKGPLASMPSLANGEFYFALDKAQLYVGFMGGNLKVVNMAVPIQDSAGGNLTSTGGALDVNIKTDAATIPVTVGNFPATQPVSGSVAVTNFPASQPTTQVGGVSGLTGDTQTKGVQGTVALMVQDFKDSGRAIKIFSASFTAATTEAMVTLTPITDGAPGSTGTTFSVTAGKKFRIQALLLTCFNATAAIHACQVNLRMTATGAVTTASPLIASVAVTTAAATANLSASQAQSFPEEIELSGTMQFGVSQIGVALAGQTVVLIGYEY